MTNRHPPEKMLADLATVWQTHRGSVLARLAATDPGKLAQIAYGLLPRDVFISPERGTVDRRRAELTCHASAARS
jgi:hypothetical protein